MQVLTAIKIFENTLRSANCPVHSFQDDRAHANLDRSVQTGITERGGVHVHDPVPWDQPAILQQLQVL